MSYLVLARKWRPQTFLDLIGQEHVSLTLKNAIDSGRVAHAFLFTGARGVGKTSSARILAKTLNCEQGPTTEPCNVCPACIEITEGNSVDVFEIDGASNTGVDDIRELRDNVKYLPSRSRYKIFIIDEVHMLSNNAFNALLKTLEEPPPHVKFIFATTEPHKVPVTILSRCQRFDFKRITLPKVLARLRYIVDQEQVSISDSSLTMVARKGDGSMRDSLSTLDQILAFCGDKVQDEDVVALLGVVDRQLILATVQGLLDRNSRELLHLVGKVDEFGYSMRQFCKELIEQMRILLLMKAVDDVSELVDLSAQESAEMGQIAERTDLQSIQRYLSILLATESDMAHSPFARLLMETALVKMATMVPVMPLDELLSRLKALETTAVTFSGASELPPPHYGISHESKDKSSVQGGGTQAAPSPLARSLPTSVVPEGTGVRDWQGFVDYVRERRPMLATKLEKGNPLKLAPGLLQIGFQKGTIEFSFLQEPDYLSELNQLATAYFSCATDVKIVPVSEQYGDVPLSLSEKKTLELAERDRRIKEAADGHPIVKAALDIFGGKIESYR